MMSQGNMCRLCAEICQDYKSLYDESGNANEVQQLVLQYFDENLLHMVTGNNSTVMCMKCWHKISDFSSFQQSIYRTQTILRVKDEEIDIKSEEEFLPEDHIATSNCEQPTDGNILEKEETTLSGCDTESMYISSADDTSNTDDSVEYDDPVGAFIGGEFGNESNSSKLLNEASKIKDSLIKSNSQNRLSSSIKASDDLIAQWTPVLKCQFCTESCSTFSLLQRHFLNKHPLLKCKVKCCSRYYSRRPRYEDHIRLHIDSNAFACTFCGAKQKCRDTLAYHIRKHHPVPIDDTINPRNDSNTPSSAKVTEISTKPIPKNIGEWKSRRTKYIKESDDFISQMKPTLNCYLCSEKHKTFSLFHQHFKESHPKEKCYITCCKRKITSRYRILEHLQLHSNPDVFTCKLCEERYSRRERLKSHMRKHHTPSIKENPKNIGEWKSCRTKHIKGSDDFIAQMKPSLNCYLCSEKYTNFSLFRQHFSESHPEEKFYITCCKRKLTSRCHILEHLQLHANPDEFKCKLCEVRYTRGDRLKSHMRKQHNTSIKENKTTSKQKNKPVKIHEKSDDPLSKRIPCTECAVCKEAFATLTELEHHFLERHPSEEFYVECCQRKLMTRRKIEDHVQYHAKPTDFKCDLCCLCYSFERGLQRHMSLVH